MRRAISLRGQARFTTVLLPLTIVVGGLLLFTVPAALAGPNAGGTLVAHDASLLYDATDGSVSICDQGSIPPDCASIDTRIDGVNAEPGAVFKVYAAFVPGTSPRLMGISWGVEYDSTRIKVAYWGTCGDFELNDPAWPGPHTGASVTWDRVQTGLLTPVYWFSAYNYAGSSAVFTLRGNPDQGGGYFGDDMIPAHLDPIDGYGAMGFDMDGVPGCPSTAAGACCLPDGSCYVTVHGGCTGVWQGTGTTCSPNPCPQPGACCATDGSCAVSMESACAAPSVWQGPNTTCSPNPCPQQGACCTPIGTCSLTLLAECPPPNSWMGVGSTCSPDPCPHWTPHPNAMGTIILHDTGVRYSGGSPCLAGTQPSQCEAADTEVDGAGPGYEELVRVYAAFPMGLSPRLMGITWGVHYNPAALVIAHWGKCGDFELNDPDWPGTDTGSSVTWNQAQTSLLVPVYYFGAYAYTPTQLELRGNPDQGGGYFGDDEVPAVLDPIAGYGSLGFDEPGYLYCPGAAPEGACCHLDGTCTVTLPDGCAEPGIWLGPMACDPNPCPPTGACCAGGTCTVSFESQCGDTWMGEGTLCDPNPCPRPGACCAANGTCMVTMPSQCAGTWMGPDTSCDPNPCPQPGACCHHNGTCTITLESQCTAPNFWQGPNTGCTPNPCPQPGACCATSGTCAYLLESECTGNWLGAGTVCNPNPCPQPLGACCHGDGTCVETTQAGCTAPGVWQGPQTTCDPNPCPQPGACCHPDGTCTPTLQSQCAGIWMGESVPCDPDPCPPPTGACCDHVTGDCTVTTQDDCPAPRTWVGPGTGCAPNPCPQPAGACCVSGGGCFVTMLDECLPPSTWLGAGSVCSPNPCPVWTQHPNAMGTIILHDTGVLYPGGSQCLAGTQPPQCEAADTEVDGAGPGSEELVRVYAAFPMGSSPRLMGITWGVHYNPSALVIAHWGRCADFELNDPGWPGTDTGSSVTWGQVQTSLLVPVYYFGAYVYAATQLELRGNPDQGGGYFGDDAIPATLDPIAGYGSLGFDEPGHLYCPEAAPEGACCHPDGSCTVTLPAGCATPDGWLGPGTVCDPNPCPYRAACCAADGTCSLTFQGGCPPPSVWHGEWMSCDPNPCPQPGACCHTNGTCTINFESGCNGTWQGPNTVCVPNPCPPPPPPPGGGGETIDDAAVIPSLPFSDSGTTCGHIQDYSDCVYNAGAPDVVYAYTPMSDGVMNVSLCGAGYDTALWVYAGGVGNTVGCNDDFCGLQSEIDGIQITGGVTYYIIVSGYNTACGGYVLNVTPVQPCDPIPCPAGGVPEDEPACYDNYYDSTNGGCNSTGWTVIAGPETICGLSGTYLYSGASYRDTDWFDAVGNGGTMTLTCTASFPLQLLFIYASSGVISCSNYSYDIGTAPCEVPVVLNRTIASGAHFWPWVGPSVFTGVDCHSTYTLEVSGIISPEPTGACCEDIVCRITTQAACQGTWMGPNTICDPNPCTVPTEKTTWGRIKSRYWK